MKIGFEAKRFFHNHTGLGNYSRDLVRILAKYYPEHNYLLYNPKKKNEASSLVNSSNVIEKLPPKKFEKFKNYWRQKAIVTDLIKDSITIFHGLSGELPFGLKQNKIKSVVTIHDLIFLRYPNLYSFWDRKIYFYKFKKAAKVADIVIAISEQTKKDIVQFLKIEPQKIKVIYQGCQDFFKQNFDEVDKKKVQEKYNLNPKFVLNVGTLEERKNALTIVKSIKDIDTQLVLIGKETSYSQKIHNYIKENNLEHKVVFLKGISSQELAIIYQLATVFVYPSIFEGFGIPIIEALFSRTPVITNKNGVFPEAGGLHSLYIEPYDDKDLKNKIEILLCNESLCAEIAEKGYEFAQKFTDEKIAKQLMLCYESLL